MKKVLVIVLALVILGAAGAYWFAGTPRYSLYVLGNAIRTGDYETARTLVDEDRIAADVSSAVVDQLVAQLEAQQRSELHDNPFAGLGAAMITMMKPQMSKIVDDQMRSSIEAGLGKNMPLDSQNKAADRVFQKEQYSGIRLEDVRMVGNSAEATFTNLPADLPTHPKQLRVRMAYMPDTRRWKVVGLPDVPVIVSQVLKDAMTSNRH